MHNKKIHMVAFLLLVIGGLNWLLHALGFNVVSMIFGGMPMVEKVIYILVGLAAVYEVATHKSSCVHCGAGGKKPSEPAASTPGGMGGGM